MLSTGRLTAVEIIDFFKNLFHVHVLMCMSGGTHGGLSQFSLLLCGFQGSHSHSELSPSPKVSKLNWLYFQF